MRRTKIVVILAAVVLLALTVGAVVQAHDTQALELKGPIQSLGGNSTVVDGKTIFINENTKIEGSLTVGAIVDIEAEVQSDGSLLALEIDAEGNDTEVDSEDEAVEFEGTVQSVGNTSIVINGKTILINGDTEIEGTLTVGTKVEVKAVTLNNGSLLANKVEAEENDDRARFDDSDEVHTDTDD